MSRTWVFCALAAILVAVLATGPQGFNATCVNTHCYISASTSLVGLIASFLLAVLISLYRQKIGTPAPVEPVKIWERFVAFFADCFVVVAIISPVTTLPILLAEASATGSFQWSFERDFSRSTDAALAGPGILLMFAGLFAYFYVHPLIARQTVGQYLLGFRVEGVPGSGKAPAFGLNVFFSYIGLCMWPVSVYLAAKRQDKAFWWNLRTHTRLIRVI